MFNRATLLRKRNRAKSRYVRQAGETSNIRADFRSSKKVWEAEDKERLDALGVLKGAKKEAFEGFSTTQAGKRFSTAARVLNRKADTNLLDQSYGLGQKLHERTGDFTKYSGSNIRPGSQRDDYRDYLRSYQEVNDYLSNTGRFRHHESRAKSSLRRLGFDDDNKMRLEDRRVLESRMGKQQKGACGSSYWNPFYKWDKDHTGHVKGELGNRLGHFFEKTGVKSQEDTIGFLYGKKRDKFGKIVKEESQLHSTKGYKKYRADVFDEQQSYYKELGEANVTKADMLAKKGRFTSAKTKLDELSTDFATLTSKFRKYERMGIGDDSTTKSKKFKKSKAGAGSYIA